jgi:hypothetical protein
MDTSYLSQQVTTIIERLHGFFDEIGVPSHERDSRESEVGALLMLTIATRHTNKSMTALLRPIGNTSQSTQPRRKGET